LRRLRRTGPPRASPLTGLHRALPLRKGQPDNFWAFLHLSSLGSITRTTALNVRQCSGSGFTLLSGFKMKRYLIVENFFTLPPNSLKGLSHIGFGFWWDVWLILGLNRGRGQFLNVLFAAMIFNAKSVFLAVNASFMHYRTDPSPHHHLLSDKLKNVQFYLFSCPWTCRTPPGVAELTSGSLLLVLPTAVTALLPTAGVWVTRRLHLNCRGAGPRVPLSLYKYTCSEFILNGWLCIPCVFI
jgi:hypothetical protein